MQQVELCYGTKTPFCFQCKTCESITEYLSVVYVTQTRLEVSNTDTCPRVELGNILIFLHVLASSEVSSIHAHVQVSSV